LSASKYILNDLPRTKLDTGISIAYTHLSKGCCYNASLLGAETLAKAYWLTREKRYLDVAKEAVAYVLSMQKADGSWYYSFNPENKTERKQIDFHQGFVLMSLHNYQKYADDKNPAIETAIKNGLVFYKKNQFFDDGRSLWRLPKEYPTEIHNQAQGIITFSELAHLDDSYLNFANTIAEFTVQNMQHKSGYFFYQKHHSYTIKIPYIRWSQAWMLLALTTLYTKSLNG
jgi:uncharacterized protein YyaL (SSP411 family)